MSDLKPGQIEKFLLQLTELQDKLADAKVILRHFKVRSDRLSQLKSAKKDIQAQMEEEKKRIEDEFLEDTDYENAKNEELTLKPKISDKKKEVKELMAQVNPDQQLSTHEYNVKGETMKVQVERVVKWYINGKEQR